MRLLRLYFAHFKDFFRWIVASVSSAHQEFPFIRLLCWYRAVFLGSFSFDFEVNIFHTFMILFHWIVRLASRTPQRFSSLELLG